MSTTKRAKSAKLRLRRSISEQLRDSTSRAWDLLWRNVRERRLAEIEAKEAYSQFPIDIPSVKRDHDFLDRDLVEPLCREAPTPESLLSRAVPVESESFRETPSLSSSLHAPAPVVHDLLQATHVLDDVVQVWEEVVLPVQVQQVPRAGVQVRARDVVVDADPAAPWGSGAWRLRQGPARPELTSPGPELLGGSGPCLECGRSLGGWYEEEIAAMETESGMAEAESSLWMEDTSAIPCSLKSVRTLSVLTVL
ncbi:hypothetical protein CRUP_034431 [Coryphaenoides rupestris]|nr:hypothetical protein CRUP_034431 [Coryphaenoides rupestris]